MHPSTANHFTFSFEYKYSKKLISIVSPVSYQGFQSFTWAWEGASSPNVTFNTTLKGKTETLAA